MKNIYYIETTLNGYVLRKTLIGEYDSNKDYYCNLNFEVDGEELEYYDDISGNHSDLDDFLATGKSTDLEDYQEEQDKYFSTEANVYLEFWRTFNLGWYDDILVGLIIK